MIQVVELSLGELEISWDENDPKESILNYLSEKDFLDIIEKHVIETMSSVDKLEKILTHIESVANLIVGNKYEMFMSQKLISLKIEVERQLSVLNAGKTVS